VTDVSSSGALPAKASKMAFETHNHFFSYQCKDGSQVTNLELDSSA
jgi:hypothetical protein